MRRSASPHDSGQPIDVRGSEPSRKRSERALALAQAINPGLGECIVLGTTQRQIGLFETLEPTDAAKELVVEREPPEACSDE